MLEPHLIVFKHGFSCRFVRMFLTTPYSSPSLPYRKASDIHSLILTKDKIVHQTEPPSYNSWTKLCLSRKGSSTVFYSPAFMDWDRIWGVLVFADFKFVQMVLWCFWYQKGYFFLRFCHPIPGRRYEDKFFILFTIGCLLFYYLLLIFCTCFISSDVTLIQCSVFWASRNFQTICCIA